jgi:hypothetical protein
VSSSNRWSSFTSKLQHLFQVTTSLRAHIYAISTCRPLSSSEFQSTWQLSAQTWGTLISHDTWHPSGADTWHSFQAFSDVSSAYFRVTHVTPPSVTHQHSDIRPPRQIILQEVLLFSAKRSTPPQSTVLIDPKVGRR